MMMHMHNPLCIYKCLYKYIEEVPKYRTSFCMRDVYEIIDFNDNIELKPYSSVICNDISNICMNIKSNTFIELVKGKYNIGEIINTPENVELNEVFDGREWVITSVEDLYIRGNDSKLIVESRYATVLSFKNCNRIVLEHLILGHSPNRGECTGAVLRFENCKNITIKYLELYGCGTYGIIFSTGDVNIQNCKIHHCSQGGIFLDTARCVIDDTEIFDCKDISSSVIEIYNGNAIISNVKIHECLSHKLMIEGNKSSVICQNVQMENCQVVDKVTNLANEKGIIKKNIKVI
mgnify:FL=1